MGQIFHTTSEGSKIFHRCFCFLLGRQVTKTSPDSCLEKSSDSSIKSLEITEAGLKGHLFSFNKLWRNPYSQSFLVLQESSLGLPVLWVHRENVIHTKKKKGLPKLNNKTYHFLQRSVSNLHIFADAPPKSPWHRPHKHREQQTAPAGACMKSCSWRDSQKQLHCHTFDLFPIQKHVVGLFCLFFFLFFLAIHSTATNAFYRTSAPHVSQLPRGTETWLARLSIFHFCLYNYLKESSILQVTSHTWVITQDLKCLISLL